MRRSTIPESKLYAANFSRRALRYSVAFIPAGVRPSYLARGMLSFATQLGGMSSSSFSSSPSAGSTAASAASAAAWRAEARAAPSSPSSSSFAYSPTAESLSSRTYSHFVTFESSKESADGGFAPCMFTQ